MTDQLQFDRLASHLGKPSVEFHPTYIVSMAEDNDLVIFKLLNAINKIIQFGDLDVVHIITASSKIDAFEQQGILAVAYNGQ